MYNKTVIPDLQINLPNMGEKLFIFHLGLHFFDNYRFASILNEKSKSNRVDVGYMAGMHHVSSFNMDMRGSRGGTGGPHPPGKSQKYRVSKSGSP